MMGIHLEIKVQIRFGSDIKIFANVIDRILKNQRIMSLITTVLNNL